VPNRLPDEYFDELYAADDDPWRLRSRWYEQRKYALTMAALPRPRYGHALELGCSIATVTVRLAERCDRVTALDVSRSALRTADLRLREAGCRDRVTLVRGSIDDPWPPHQFDLVVLSEVGYYLDATTLESVLRRELPGLASGATVVAVHWRHAVDEYPQTGDAVHRMIAAIPGMHALCHYQDDDFLLDVYDTSDGRSVAAREGLPGAC
jgi:SAM-dependent methyltransferase